jgi:hypothetical protein
MIFLGLKDSGTDPMEFRRDVFAAPKWAQQWFSAAGCNTPAVEVARVGTRNHIMTRLSASRGRALAMEINLRPQQRQALPFGHRSARLIKPKSDARARVSI